MTDIAADKIETENFFLFGSNGAAELQALGEQAEKMLPKIAAGLKLDDAAPFLKGNTSIFVFQRQYDFSEFGTMIVKTPLPKEVRGYWGFNTIDAYASLLLKRGKSPEDVQVALARQIGAIKVASLATDVPRWFADGLGHWIAERVFPRDEATKQWDDQAEAIVREMSRPSDFLAGRLPEHQAALVSYLFVKQLRSDTKRFNKLLKMLREQQSFEKAFLASYGTTPNEMFGARASRPNRRRR